MVERDPSERPTNLQPAHTTFVGRRAELDTLVQLASGGGIVTITGPPGVGKSRLGHAFGANRHAQGAGGVWTVPVADVTTEAGLGLALAAAVSIQAAAPGGDHWARGCARLALVDSPVLILDGAEHLDGLLEAPLAQLQRVAPQASIVVTSRGPLGVPGERVFELPPFPVADEEAPDAGADAIELFLGFARLVRPGFVASPAVLKAIARITRLCEGMPLAIALAAGRVDVLSVRELARRLESSFDVLGGSGLDASIHSAWSSLSDDGRSALAQLGVFVGGFDALAAEAVVRTASPVLDLLQSLRRHSLIRSYSPGELPDELRFEPYAAIRDFVASRPGYGRQIEEAIDRHGGWYRDQARAWFDETQRGAGGEGRLRFVLDRANLWAVGERGARAEASGRRLSDAVCVLGSMEVSEEGRGQYLPYVELLSAVLDAPELDAVEPASVAAAYRARGRALLPTGRLPEAEADLHEALSRATALSEHGICADALWGLFVACRSRGDRVAARRFVERGIEAARAAGEPAITAPRLATQGALCGEEGRPAEAFAAFDEAMVQYRLAGYPQGSGLVNYYSGELHRELGELELAGADLLRALSILDQDGRQLLAGHVHLALVLVHHEAERMGEARASAADALEIYRGLGDQLMPAHVEAAVAGVDWEQGRLAQAREAYRRAIARMEETGQVWAVAPFTFSLAAVEAGLGRLDEADTALRRAEELLPSSPEPTLPHVAELVRGLVALAHGDARAAVDRLAAVRADEGQPFGRFARVRLVARVLERGIQALSAVDRSDALAVGPEARWFRAPGGQVVELKRRALLRRLLMPLAEARTSAPGEPVSLAELIERGWPGERALPESAANRAYVALSNLRGLGLRGLLLTVEGGYLLDPDVPMGWREER